MEDGEKTIGTLVTGVIGNDVHISGIRILEYALRQEGFNVVSLGAMTAQEDFINAAIETKADAILISSLNGHAKICVQGFKEKCIEAGLKDVMLYIGGMLVVGEERFELTWEQVEQMFKDLGFDRVYQPGVLPAPVIADIKADLAVKGGV
jgi:methylaspartate mutase sigma subunit